MKSSSVSRLPSSITTTTTTTNTNTTNTTTTNTNIAITSNTRRSGSSGHGALRAAVLLTSCLLGSVRALTPGPHPPYDSLCVSNAPAIPAPWDCGGFIRCQTDPGADPGAGAGVVPEAVWVVCDPGKQYDHLAGQCVAGYTGCLAPHGELI